ncbi:translation initiation factor IF-2-like [Vulpes lagopus]|uniref:translation initiation factor IF-2-like n=1 Tax=Vulpes lagopus TaxID=494514 RepID=UPI001BCA03FE|nr:translation initiation factor IF-2-like [Vulpes lagopus]
MKEEDLRRRFRRPPPSPRPPGQDGGKRPPGRTPRPLPLAAVQPPARSPGNPGRQLRAPEQGPGRRGEAAKRGRRHHLLAARGRPGTRRRRDPARPPAARGLQVAPLQRRAATPAPARPPGEGEGGRPPPPSPLQTRGGRPRGEGGQERGRAPHPKFGLPGHRAGRGAELNAAPGGKHTRPRGRGKPFPAPLHTAAARPTFSFFQQLRNWGAFMAPREEGSQAERMSPLRHPFLSPLPSHTHTHNLNSSPAVAAQPPAPLRPPGCGLLTPQAPTFSQTPPLPLHLGAEGGPPPASMRKCPRGSYRQEQPPIRSRGGRKAWPMRRAEVAGGGASAREPRGGGRAEPDPGRRLRGPHVRRRGRGCLTG